jgi:Holliday junction resolvasome RuvABC endonuclease subunit
MIIAAFDIASVTGVAVGSSGGVPTCWSKDLGKGRSQDVRFSEMLRLAQGVLEAHKPDLVMIEAPIGGKHASAFLIGLAACARGVCANRGVKCESVAPSTVRRHFMGVAKTSRHFPGMSAAKAKLQIKREVLQRCQLLGWDVPDLDAADAAATWDYACATYAPAYQSKPLGELFG